LVFVGFVIAQSSIKDNIIIALQNYKANPEKIPPYDIIMAKCYIGYESEKIDYCRACYIINTENIFGKTTRCIPINEGDDLNTIKSAIERDIIESNSPDLSYNIL